MIAAYGPIRVGLRDVVVQAPKTVVIVQAPWRGAELAVDQHVRAAGWSTVSASAVPRWDDKGDGLVTRIGTAVDGRTVVDLRIGGGSRNTIIADEIEIYQLSPAQAQARAEAEPGRR